MIEDAHLLPQAANHCPLTPLDFLDRAVEVFPARPAVAWRDRVWTYAEFGAIVRRLAAFLAGRGIRRGDVVSIVSLNRPEMLAAHYAVPMLGAILNTINTRLDAAAVAGILDHSGSRLLLADPASAALADAAAALCGNAVAVVELDDDPAPGADGRHLHLLAQGTEAPAVEWRANVTDEWQPIALNYTSGTTGRPKGVVYHHRGAYLNALGNVLALRLDGDTSYLWTLPMFPCNGWCHTWAVTAAGGQHVCLERVDPAMIFEAIDRHSVTHLSCAPVVLYLLVNHSGAEVRRAERRLTVATGGAAPTSALIEQLDALGFDLIHLYGLTESFGPATLRILSDEEASSDAASRAALLARQGVRHTTASRLRVVDTEGWDVPRDGVSTGEIVLRGNTLMAGYYGDPEASAQAFAGDVLHTGDIAVMHPDGSIQITDRSKDVIISGGENISSLEVESVLHRHPAVLLAAVVAAPDEKWGEVPFAFIELKEGAQVDAEELARFCRQHLAGFKIPRRYAFRTLPKTGTGKIQKFMLRALAAGGDAAAGRAE